MTSQPVHPLTLDYYLHLLAGVPASHARARLTMLCAYDASPRPLTQKILERPRLLQRIRYAIHDRARSYLTVFNSTPLERKLSVLLGIPLNGLDPALAEHGTKSGSRRVFREAGVDLPAGFEDLDTRDDVVQALAELQAQRPGIRRAVIKLNDSFSGEGNALVSVPATRDARGELRRAVDQRARCRCRPRRRRATSRSSSGWAASSRSSSRRTRRSRRARSFAPARRARCSEISTHDQILGGESGQIYLGLQLPARATTTATQIRDAGTRDRRGAGAPRRRQPLRRRLPGLAQRRRGGWHITALEINLRVLGTTHPFLALRFLTGGELDTASGQFLSLSGRPKYYRATDNLRSKTLPGILPEDLFDIVSMNGLHYSHRTESGVLFHMIGAVSEFGKLGVTVIGNDVEEVGRLYGRVIDVLDAECAIGQTPSEIRDSEPGVRS